MLTTIVLLLTLSAAEPAKPVPMLVVTVHGPSQAQLERRAALTRARADHVWRLERVAELAKLQAESLAAARTRVAEPPALASDREPVRTAEVRIAGAPRPGPAGRIGRPTTAKQ